MKKEFNLVIEEDIVPFFAIDVDDITGRPVGLSQQKKLFAFKNNAKIVNISHLNYRPDYDSEYSEDQKDFLNSTKLNVIALEENVYAFAYLVNNIFYGASYLKSGDLKMDMLIAAMNSNPAIVERENNE